MNELRVTGKQKIGNIEFTGIEGGFGKENKAMTVKDIAEIHGTEVRRINEVINRNRKRFINGVDIVDLKSAIVLNDNEISKFGFTQNAFNASKNIYILSERGYAKLLKILEDDTAWEIYDELVDNYFSMREQVKIPNTPRELAKLALVANEETNERVDAIESDLNDLKNNQLLAEPDYRTISNMVRNKIRAICNQQHLNSKAKAELFKDLNGGIKRITGAVARNRIKAKQFDDVIEFINNWMPSTATMTIIKQMELLEDE